ncbi:MAG: radical SAM protein [bacterium]|nr:radical SAM protein [bacterium]
MEHIGQIFRPPSEANSLLLQISLGCSHNKCTYCAMYDHPDQKFRIKKWETIAADIAEAAQYSQQVRPIQRVFLCDGDALILPQDFLEKIMRELKEQIPSVRRIGIYGDARSILRKSPEQLATLKKLGLGIVYHGVETGHDKTLLKIQKGSTAAEAVQSAQLLRNAGIRHSVIVMLGIGGKENSLAHAQATAEILTQMDPPFVGALTTTLVPGTPLFEEGENGQFELPDPWDMLEELRIIIRESNLSRCRFHSNHASNYLPLSLNLPTDKEKALMQLDQVLDRRDGEDLKPDFLRGL